MTTQKEETLPIEVFKQVVNYLNIKEINYLSRTCNYFYHFFRKDNYFLSSFLIIVSHGEQDLAEQVLKNIDLTLMVKKGTIIDYSKRRFTDNSAFQYILGALDTRYMFTMFLQCLRDDKKYSIQKKKEIEAITALFEIRTKDKRAIAQKLEDLIQEFDLALESEEQVSLQMK